MGTGSAIFTNLVFLRQASKHLELMVLKGEKQIGLYCQL